MTRVIDTYELSPMQAGMLFHALRGGDPGVDIMQTITTLRQPVDEAQLLRAWQRVVERHPVLRSSFRWEGVEAPVQDVFDRAEIPVDRLDWRALGEVEGRQQLEALLDRDRIRGIDLARAPLMRLTLVRAPAHECWMLLTYHHAILDGRARLIVLREVFAFYEAFLRGEDTELPLPRPYRDYIEWRRGLDHNAAKHYWQRVLAGFTAPTSLLLARDRQSADETGSDLGSLESRLPIALTGALMQRARDASVTLNTLLQGAWALLLQRYSGESDIVFGAVRACRRSALGGADEMVGVFINTLPVRVQVEPEAGLVPWLQELRAQQVAVRDYEHTPLLEVQGWSGVPRGTPLFESILIFENQTLDARLRALGGAWSERRLFVRGQADTPLVLNAWGGDELVLQLQYSRRRFAGDLVARMLDHLQMLLDGMAAHSHARLGDLPLITQAERKKLLVEWNDTAAQQPAEALVHELFEAQAARAPERTALRVGATTLSYAELDSRAHRLAQALRSRGVGRGQRVGLCVERGADMLAAVLGILFAGAAYVPLDPSFPLELLSFMAGDAQLALLVSTSALAKPFAGLRKRLLLLDADARDIAAAPDTRLPVDAYTARPEDPAYVIYTSGSTGKQKGVVVPHRAVVNLLTSMAHEPGLTADDALVAVTTLSFDIAVLELQLPLTLGATVVIATRDQARDGRALSTLLEENHATVMQATPATWRLLLDAGWRSRLPFKALVGGEALPKDLADQLLARGVELWNLYGPTETTVWSTDAHVTDTSDGISIGKPIANTTVYVLDAQRNPCPIGVPGELYIGGLGVTLGYWNRPELTAERFIPDPFSANPGATLYRTGDRVRWRNNGTLEHLGRLDDQAKVRGFRIELGEIEAALAEHPEVRQAAVHVWNVGPNDLRIVACCVPAKAGGLAPITLRKHLRARLPDYMIPQHFLSVDEIPLLPNGKIDRSKLPTPAVTEGRFHPREAPSDPIEATIAEIWTNLIGPARPIGRADKFFEMGGHSLLALRALHQIEQKLGVKLHLRVLLEESLADIATRCRKS